MAAKKKTIWLLTILLFCGVNLAEAQQAVKTPSGVKLHWEDTSDNEKGFRIYRVTPKGKTKIGEVGANVTTYTDKSPTSTACYAVTAFNSAGESDPSNVSCVGNASATKGRRLCEIELSPRGLKLLAEVEQTFNKQVREGRDPSCGGNWFLRYPCLKNFFHNCLITNDLEAAKAWLSPLKRPLTEKLA